MSQTRKAINALDSIWWQKNITKNRKFYIYQSILVYGAEVWQIPTREINKILSTEGGQQENQRWKEQKVNI
jgi:hypothetical protein